MVRNPCDEQVTRLLGEIRAGDSDAAAELLPIVYDELRGIAGRVFKTQQVEEITIQPTIFVHDVFMKLVKTTTIDWENRSHFFAVAARATRDLLVDHARRRQAVKRGGGWNRITLSGLKGVGTDEKLIDVIDLENALERLGRLAPRQEKIVEMRFYGGLTVEEVAAVLNISRRTVMYDWRMARAWLRTHLNDEGV